MFLRKFCNGRISPLTMSAEGAADAGAGGAVDKGGAADAGAAKSYTFTSDKPFNEQLPEKYRADANFRDIKNFDGLLDSFSHAQRLVGADKATLLQVPKGDDPKEWNDFYNRQGRPEAADKYVLAKPATGEYSDADKAFQSKILPALYDAGLTQRQLDKITPVWNAMQAETAGASTKAAEAYATEQQGKLKTQLGAAYDETVSDAQAAAVHLGGEDLLKELNIVKDGKATGDNAQLMLALGKIGKTLREDGIIGKAGGNAGGALTPADAQREIAALNKNDDFIKVLRSKEAVGKNPDGTPLNHDDAVKRMAKLYADAYPPQDAA